MKTRDGQTNPSDMMTKEDKSVSHFISIRDENVPPPFSANRTELKPCRQVRFHSNVSIQTFQRTSTPSTLNKWKNIFPRENMNTNWKTPHTNNIATSKQGGYYTYVEY